MKQLELFQCKKETHHVFKGSLSLFLILCYATAEIQSPFSDRHRLCQPLLLHFRGYYKYANFSNYSLELIDIKVGIYLKWIVN